jgi:hypothetical protein
VRRKTPFKQQEITGPSIECDVHGNLRASIAIVEHPFFAATDQRGRFAIPAGWPRGRWKVDVRSGRARDRKWVDNVDGPRRVGDQRIRT